MQDCSAESLYASAVRGLRSILWLLLGSLAVFMVGLVTAVLTATNTAANGQHQSEAAVMTAALSAVLITVYFLWRTYSGYAVQVTGWLAEASSLLDDVPIGKLTFYIILASCLQLFAELMIIRLHASYFQLFAHFRNISLLSCFLGLGIGYAQKLKTPVLMPLFLPSIAVQIFFLYSLRLGGLNYLLSNPTGSKDAVGLHGALTFSDVLISMGFVGLVFIFNSLCFIPLGQLAARFMARLPELKAYSWNLVGSLLGIALFTLLCFLWAPPLVWLIALALFSFFFLRSFASVIAGVVATLVTALLLAFVPTPFTIDIFSPYQIITINTDNQDYWLNADNTFFQRLLDLRPEIVERQRGLVPTVDYYRIGYLFKPNPQDVLIVGAGTGNDVASAIRNNAGHVDAVEIDPSILYVGKHLHPEKPYDDARVTIINTDARYWIKYTKKKYDLINYALIDSQSKLVQSGLLRTDSYIWTVEGFREARAHLNPGGLIVATICTKGRLGPRVFRMLTKAFDGRQPVAYKTGYDDGICLIIGDDTPKPLETPQFDELTQKYANSTEPVDLATDDWPFLFIWTRDYPYGYMLVIFALLCLSWVMMRRLVTATVTSFSWSCFFLGAGFMLIETKGIAELSLVYGSTWMVASIVIAMILLLAFLANLLVMRFGPPKPLVSYGLVLLSLIAGFVFCGAHYQSSSETLDRFSTTLLVTLPVFFSGLAFSQELKKTGSVTTALYSNLFGAMVGGFFEYNSLYFGFRSLYLFAIAFYLTAFLLPNISSKFRFDQTKI